MVHSFFSFDRQQMQLVRTIPQHSSFSEEPGRPLSSPLEPPGPGDGIDLAFQGLGRLTAIVILSWSREARKEHLAPMHFVMENKPRGLQSVRESLGTSSTIRGILPCFCHRTSEDIPGYCRTAVQSVHDHHARGRCMAPKSQASATTTSACMALQNH